MTTTKKPWTRLSELPGRREFGICQACGEAAKVTWQECDDDDLPEEIYLRLCRPCSDRLIEPHRRLYRQVAAGESAPGAMACCADCVHRLKFDCRSPLLKSNGGPGLPIHVNQVGYCCTRGKGGRCRPIFDGPPVCDGKQTADER